MSTENNIDTDNSSVGLLEKKSVKPPNMYQVILLNDDFTPMDFVVMILQSIFNKNTEQAQSIMLKVHYEGKGVCGIYTRDIAATKVEQVLKLASAHEHPLQCIMQVADN